MTAKNEFEMPFLINVLEGCKIIFDGLRKYKRTIEFPWQTTIVVEILRMIPTKWFEAIALKDPKLKCNN